MTTAANLFSMFALGVLGAPHCAGMCGPLVLSLAAQAPGARPQVAYHAGRLTTYVALAAMLGGAGAGLGAIEHAATGVPARTATVQVIVSLGSALLLIGFGLERLGAMPRLAARLPGPSSLPGFARVRAGVRAGSTGAVFAWGLLMGFLPCGLSWAALARALAASGPFEAGVLVLVFGLGTLPSLVLVGTAGAELARRHRKVMELAAGVLMIGLGLQLGVSAVGALGAPR